LLSPEFENEVVKGPLLYLQPPSRTIARKDDALMNVNDPQTFQCLENPPCNFFRTTAGGASRRFATSLQLVAGARLHRPGSSLPNQRRIVPPRKARPSRCAGIALGLH